VDAGIGEQVIDKEFVGVGSGEVGAHIERDAAKGHGFEEFRECVPGVFFVTDGVWFGEVEGFVEEECEGFVFFTAEDFVPGFVEAFGFRIDVGCGVVPGVAG
jgi:hypothetical protein